MANKFFMHRIKLENEELAKGIEVHDTLDSAILSFHNYMGLWAYDNPEKPDVQMVSCKITDKSGSVIKPYDETWNKAPVELEEGEEPVEPIVKYFMHYIRQDGENFTKNIDAEDVLEDAKRSFHSTMAYGYNNSKHPDVSFVSCEITDMNGNIVDGYDETWIQAGNE